MLQKMIETQNLVLIPLTYAELEQYTHLDGRLEKTLNLNPTPSRTISAELKEALTQTILPAVLASDTDFRYSTLWTIVAKKSQQMVGDLCFMGKPNPQGEVEIGYGTYEAFWGKGLMTEAVSGVVLWAKTQTNIKTIKANTLKDNTASYVVLQKNGFIKTNETNDLYHWSIDI